MTDFSVNTIRVNNSGGRTLLENWVEEVRYFCFFVLIFDWVFCMALIAILCNKIY